MLTRLCAAVVAVIAPLSGTAAQAIPRASVVTVTTCDDSGPGSLREAVAGTVSGDIVDISQLPCTNHTIALTSGAIVVPIDGITIGGVPLPRAAQPDGIVASDAIIDGGTHDRVFDHAGTGSFTLIGVTLRNGAVDGPGGCLRSSGNVTLVASVVSGCVVTATTFGQGLGGGVFADGTLYMADSRISGNTVHGDSFVRGGGVFVSGALTMTRSSVTENTALATSGVFGFGGGLYAGSAVSISYSTIAANTATDSGGADLLGQDNALLSISNTTISGNHGGSVGGLLALQAPLNMASSTIAFNVATAAGGTGGLAIGNPSLIESSIIADNTSPSGAADVRAQCGIGGSCDGIVVSGSNNLIMAADIPVPGDTLGVDPLLQPLADNGGLTKTHALAFDSPAIDHGNANGTGTHCLSYDQRGPGYLRAAGGGVDIGAFELGAGPDRIFGNGFEREALVQQAERPAICP